MAPLRPIAACATRVSCPKAVRDFFLSFLAAKQACIPFEDFKDAMEDRDETRASRNGHWPPSVPSS